MLGRSSYSAFADLNHSWKVSKYGFSLQTSTILKGHLSSVQQQSLCGISLYNHKIYVFAAKIIAFLIAVYASTAGTSPRIVVLPHFMLPWLLACVHVGELCPNRYLAAPQRSWLTTCSIVLSSRRQDLLFMDIASTLIDFLNARLKKILDSVRYYW